jgi:hypothetical protein
MNFLFEEFLSNLFNLPQYRKGAPTEPKTFLVKLSFDQTGNNANRDFSTMLLKISIPN